MTPLVLLPAFPLAADMYDPVRDRMSCPIVTPNLPGFGDAPMAQGEPTLDAYADAVIEHLDQEGISEFALGGTSMGGYVAMVVLRRWRDRVRGLALIDTKATADFAEAVAGRLALADLLTASQSTKPLIDAVLPKLLGATTTMNDPELVQRVRRAVEGVDPLAAAWAQRAMASRSAAFDALSAVGIPATVIVGKEDVLAPPVDARAMVDAVAGAKLVLIEDAGHLTPLEAPDRVSRALTTLMMQVAAS